MATWEDLDNVSESGEEEAEEEAKIAMALVATVENEDESSDAESCTYFETETEVYSKLTRSELVDSKGEKNHKRGGLNCVFKNFSFLRSEELFPGSESEVVQSLSEFRV